uniref:Grx4 family monothiol glutaredoxin n=1 Tax=Enhygromyxa salina TaxID=215803 RepID=UPI001C63321D|nr:Grx4 family monothiol glutaredoxin [Enhygromyxa salina]
MSELPEPTRAKIRDLVASDRVVLFMKGTRRSPQCGFSASVIELLDGWIDDYETVDVLADPEIREGVKVFSDWPTIPQLYVDGEFVGGADILRELEGSGELGETLGAAEPEPPQVTITEAAAAQFKAALAGSDIDERDILRLTIDARFHNDLSVGPSQPGDIEVESAGVRLAFDRRSARRARGLRIDFIDAADGAGFKIDNPNAPPEVKELSVTELASRLEQAKTDGAPLHLYDVRTEHERATAMIEGSTLLDADVAEAITELPRDTPLYFHCHHGHRSLRAGQHFIAQGFVEVYNVTGGIDAWSQQVDDKVPRY